MLYCLFIVIFIAVLLIAVNMFVIPLDVLWSKIIQRLIVIGFPIENLVGTN